LKNISTLKKRNRAGQIAPEVSPLIKMEIAAEQGCVNAGAGREKRQSEEEGSPFTRGTGAGKSGAA